MKRAFLLSIVCLLALSATVALADDAKKHYDKEPDMKIDPAKTYTVTIDTNKGKIVLTLFAKDAPHTVNSFVFLAKEKFFDGLTFHRVIPGFMIQGGDPKGDGTGGPGYEFANENPNTTHGFKPGTIAMANAGPNTNGSQFFIMDADYGLQPQDYTIFGELKEGQDVVDAIATTPRDGNDKPNDPVIMKTVTVEEK